MQMTIQVYAQYEECILDHSDLMQKLDFQKKSQNHFLTLDRVR